MPEDLHEKHNRMHMHCHESCDKKIPACFVLVLVLFLNHKQNKCYQLKKWFIRINLNKK